MRTGDSIEDWCPHCRLLLQHQVAALVEGEVKKVVCNTCHSEHPYRKGKGGRRTESVADLFQQVLGSGPPGARSGPRTRLRKKRSSRGS